jgi:hypothetical protein
VHATAVLGELAYPRRGRHVDHLPATAGGSAPILTRSSRRDRALTRAACHGIP